MERVLVVLDDSDKHRKLLAEAASVAKGTDAKLVLFTHFSQEDFERDREVFEAAEAAERADYTDPSPTELLENFVKSIVQEVFDAHPPEYELETDVVEDTDAADAILSAAQTRDCDHIYLVGQKRSPTGKVLFGDVAQSVILNFDGFVTTAME